MGNTTGVIKGDTNEFSYVYMYIYIYIDLNMYNKHFLNTCMRPGTPYITL